MQDHDLKGKAAITGLGITEQGRVYGHDAVWFAAEAIRLAVEDAGLRKDEIDGLLVNQGVTPLPGMGGLELQNILGLTNMRLLASMEVGGATAGVMVQYAAMAVAHGVANHVVCVFADAPLREGRGGGAAYGGARLRDQPRGMRGLSTAFGVFGVNARYALAARRHMGLYGTTNDHFGSIAVAQRQWAALNPIAQQREPITIEEYHASRWIVEPLHLLDCCLVSNGGVAVIVSSADRAKDLRQPPAYIWGMGQGHPGDLRRAG
jgi:acetyl-CoA acetyltransferase